MNSSVPIVVYGASGRMGQAILRLAMRESRMSVVAAIVKSDSGLRRQALREAFGADAGDVEYSTSLGAAVAPTVLIDFSSAEAFDGALALALARRIAFVSGTTGLTSAQRAAMENAATTIPVLWSANFSIGVTVLTRLARDAARMLADWDCEIAEAHHRNKKDAPSGTALALGRAIAEARGADFDRVAQLERARQNAMRDSATIGFAVTRGGDIVGEHTVMFAGDGERIELVHRATDREVFARGAVEAAVWIAAQPHGMYALADVLEHRSR
jgi:4-hydroxy-tetrahydrodipicolinate reductase